jgi:hypothetical protein
MLKEYTVNICDACYELQGEECHTPNCVFYLCDLCDPKTVRHMLNILLIRPIVDGESIKAQAGEPMGEGHRLQQALTTLRGKVIEWADYCEEMKLNGLASIMRREAGCAK